MLPNLRDPVDATVRGPDLNLHICHVWWNSAPLLGDDYQRACIGTDLNWQVLTVYWQVRNNFGRKVIHDTFGFEWGGSPEEEAINATIHLQGVKNLRDLPGDETFWGTFEIVWKQWVRWVATLAEVRAGKPLPVPVPPPPAPKPQPPVDTSPQEPNAWWDCKHPECIDDNPQPPKSVRCWKWHWRPGYEPAPAPKPAPTVPGTPNPKPSPGTDWKGGMVKAGLALAAFAGLLSIASFFVPALAPIAAALKALGALLSSIGK